MTRHEPLSPNDLVITLWHHEDPCPPPLQRFFGKTGTVLAFDGLCTCGSQLWLVNIPDVAAVPFHRQDLRKIGGPSVKPGVERRRREKSPAA